MLKKFLIVTGVISTGFIASCSLLLGFSAVNDAPKNKVLAESITRDLARGWNVSDIRPYFPSSGAEQVNFAAAQASFNPLKPLGSLQRIDQAQQTAFAMEKNLGEWLTKTATVAMVGTFEHGRANVTVELRSERGQMKLRAVNVTPIDGVRAKGQPA
jgi:hypothetical protein